MKKSAGFCACKNLNLYAAQKHELVPAGLIMLNYKSKDSDPDTNLYSKVLGWEHSGKVHYCLYLVNHIVEDWGNAQNRDLREAHPEDPVEPAEKMQFGIHAELGNMFLQQQLKMGWQIYSERKNRLKENLF